MTDALWPGERAILSKAKEGAVWAPSMLSRDLRRLRGQVLASFATGTFDLGKLGPIGLEAAGSAFPQRPVPIAIRAALASLEIVGHLDFFEKTLVHDLIISGARFADGVQLSFAKTRRICLHGSHFAAGLNAQGMKSAGDVDLSESVTEQEIRLTHAEIWGDLTLEGLKDLVARRGTRGAGGDIAPTIDASNLELMGNLKLTDAQLHGPLLLTQARLSRSLIMQRLETESYVIFYEASIGGDLDAGGAILKGRDERGCALNATGAKIGAAMLIDDGFTAETGSIRLYGATICGNLEANGAILKGCDEQGYALNAEGAKIGAAVLIRDGFTAETGSIRLYGATIGGNLEADGAILQGRDEQGYALDAEGAQIGPAVLIRDGFTTEAGGVRLYGATIGGTLDAHNAILNGRDGDGSALDATGAKIGAEVVIRDGFTTKVGGVCLYGATIGGNIQADGAILKGCDEQGYALNAEGAKIGAAVLIRDGFTTEAGGLRFFGATIGTNFDASNSKLNGFAPYGTDSRVGKSLDLYQATIKGRLWLADFESPPKGEINLADAKAGSVLFGSPGKNGLWSRHCGLLFLDGFQFDTLTYTTTRSRDWRKLLQRQWFPNRGRRFVDIHRFFDQIGFRPQPWTMAAEVLERTGHEGEARKLRVARDKRIYRDEPKTAILGRIWGFILHWIVGYGHAPHLVAIWFALAVALGGFYVFPKARAEGFIAPAREEVLLDPSYKNSMAPPDGYPAFDPRIYAVDAFLPVLDLRQVDYWSVSGPYRAYFFLHSIFGWLVVSLGALSLAGFVGRK